MFSTISAAVKTLFDVEKPSMQIIEISGFDPAELPKGFFNVITSTGKITLGYNGATITSYDVGETVNDGKLAKLDKPRSELPTVKLPYGSRNSSEFKGHTIIEVDATENDGGVSWAGSPPSSGVQYR
jgi:hypothetical protein